MTRFCIQCNRIIGEKCVQCGTEATASSDGHTVTGADFDCPSCGHHFLQGDGGATGGMCEPCFDAELRKAREQVATLGEGKIVTLQTTHDRAQRAAATTEGERNHPMFCKNGKCA